MIILLTMLTNMGINDYIHSLRYLNQSSPEIDTILMAVFFDYELQFYFFNQEKLEKRIFNSSKTNKMTIRLYLNEKGKFCTIYKKIKMETAGICQSLILDVMKI